MIAISCSHCHSKVKVKDELAGKRIRCPHCQHVQEVPLASAGAATVPARKPAGSQAKASVPEDATLPTSFPTASVADEATIPPSAAHLPGPTVTYQANDHEPADGETREVVKAGSAYEVEGEIARGGMGAIMRAVDQDIRREVAVKFLLNQADESQKTRFIEEAQITGQLEHPNIVPIHQLGVHEDGRCFFSMKMVKGRSLSDILKDQDEMSGRAEFTLGRLLNIFSSICNGLAYAHSRQVIHRDLKPANIMVGDFGEVYVMDWGLAKVLGREETAEPRRKISKKPSANKVATSRAVDSNLTQAGAIMGTPAYMPPEQAAGEAAAVDKRSDIYSLGAILYEILTLSPPVGRGGDHLAVLMRVVDGAITPPEKQAPERARRGLIAPELSAVALKALAKDPAGRYQTVEALQHDVQLYLEGRSVSAKRDSAWELFKKLVKRNKGVSLATAAALAVLSVVVGFFLKINYDARIEAEDNYAAYLKADEEKRAGNKQSAPAFVRAARLLMADKQFADALTQVDTALQYDADQSDAYLLRGQLLLGLERYAEAAAPLDEYLRRKPDDGPARQLAALAGKPELDQAAYFLSLNEIFQQQNALALAGHMAQLAERFLGPMRERLPVYRKRIEAAWPGIGKRLLLNEKGELRLDVAYLQQVRDLEPLKGIPLSTLSIAGTRVADLAPLKGMPLFSLNIARSNVADLEPVRGLPLVRLDLYGFYGKGSPIRDLGALQGMKLKHLDLAFCYGVTDLGPLRGMPLEHLELRDCSIADLEPLRDMPLTHLGLFDCRKVHDVGPLQSLKKLKHLHLASCYLVKDLSPLRGLPLERLFLNGLGKVRDFEPLQGMKLTYLNLGRCRIQDLHVLKEMPLTGLDLAGCVEITDLAALRGMKLTFLNVSSCKKIQDFAPLRDLPLTALYLNDSRFHDPDILRGLKHLETLEIRGCADLKDVRPLDGMQLKTIQLTPGFIQQGLEVLRRMKSLEKITVDGNRTFEPAEFWKAHDKGEFKK